MITSVHKAQGYEKPPKVSLKDPSKISKKEMRDMQKFKECESDIYNLFKYSFNYSLKEKPLHISVITTKREATLTKLLQVDMTGILKRQTFFTDNQNLKLNKLIDFKISHELETELAGIEDNTSMSFYLPPTWNSIVGLRGVALKCNMFEEVQLLHFQYF